MSEMLEKVARALHAEATQIMDANGEVPDNWDDCGPDHDKARAEWCKLAIAAIKAMREPDEEMIAAGTRSIMAHGRVSNAVCNAWRNMCRSILSTPTTRGEVK